MKKFITSFLIITLLIVLSVGVTKAYFTSSVNNDNNQFSSGTIKVSLTDENNQEYASPAWNISNITPGWNTGSNPSIKTFKVNNIGSLDFKYQLTFNPNVPSGESNNALYKAMMVSYKIGNNDWIDKTLEDLMNDTSITGTVSANSSSQDILIKPYLPTTTGNTAQDGTFNFSLIVKATQTNNPTFNQ